jgi:hypothetical protein
MGKISETFKFMLFWHSILTSAKSFIPNNANKE